MKIIEKLKNLMKNYLTDGKGEPEFSKIREVLPSGNREMTRNQKTTSEEMAFGASTGARSGIVNRTDSIATEYILSRANVDNSHEAVEVLGLEPGKRGLTIPATRPATPTADLLYQENSGVATSKIKITCPYCGSEEFVKRGTRQKKREKVQLYICQTNQEHDWFEELIKKYLYIRRKVLNLQRSWQKYMNMPAGGKFIKDIKL